METIGFILFCVSVVVIVLGFVFFKSGRVNKALKENFERNVQAKKKEAAQPKTLAEAVQKFGQAFDKVLLNPNVNPDKAWPELSFTGNAAFDIACARAKLGAKTEFDAKWAPAVHGIIQPWEVERPTRSTMRKLEAAQRQRQALVNASDDDFLLIAISYALIANEKLDLDLYSPNATNDLGDSFGDSGSATPAYDNDSSVRHNSSDGYSSPDSGNSGGFGGGSDGGGGGGD
ncbi:MAG: hypothetical protein VX154_04935 [Pseudomonadota bacterium]|nr:hypothetical protein [Pseudomonadota bacterium]